MEQQQQKRQRPQQQQQQPQSRVPCARCGSSDTKFCYYNNYNTSQPRYYCRTCKRHWTHGGTLRNVPEGGSSKKSKKKSSPSSSTSLKLPEAQALNHQMPAVAAGLNNSNRAPAMPPPFFYGCGGRTDGLGGLIGDGPPGLPAPFNPAVIVGDFGRSNLPTMPPGFNPLDGISLQQLVQQPRLSMALHQNLLMFQQQQGWQQQQMNAPVFTSTAASTIVATTTAATTEERNRNYNILNMSGAPRPPPSSSFM